MEWKLSITGKYFEQKNIFVQSIESVPKTKVKEKPLTLCVSMAWAHYFLVLLPGKKTCIINMKNMVSVTSTKSIHIYNKGYFKKEKQIHKHAKKNQRAKDNLIQINLWILIEKWERITICKRIKTLWGNYHGPPVLFVFIFPVCNFRRSVLSKWIILKRSTSYLIYTLLNNQTKYYKKIRTQ